MRVEAYGKVQQVYQTGKKVNHVQKSAGYTSDAIEISSFGRDIQTAQAAVAATSDIREDKVAPLRESIANGTYQVDGSTFAEKLMQKYEESL